MATYAPKRMRKNVPSPRKRKTSSGRIKLIGLLLASILCLGLGVFAYKMFFAAPVAVAPGTQVEVSFPEGASGKVFGSTLYEAGLIDSTSVFSNEVQAQNADMALKPGHYTFTAGISVADIVKQLVIGPNADKFKLVVPEGLTIDKLADRVNQTFGISVADFKQAAKASRFKDRFAFLSEAQNDSLEGFLYPKTYTFKTNPTSDEIIRVMLEQYQKEVQTLDFDSARKAIAASYGVDMSNYDFLIMASIIEREATSGEEMYLVSSVFYNRLKKGMPLQSDATMGYVTGGEVRADDLKQQSPYNTYLNKGLAPTPICSPSLAAIKAALAPKQTDYLFFWIDKHESAFSKTYEEHQAAIERAKAR